MPGPAPGPCEANTAPAHNKQVALAAAQQSAVAHCLDRDDAMTISRFGRRRRYGDSLRRFCNCRGRSVVVVDLQPADHDLGGFNDEMDWRCRLGGVHCDIRRAPRRLFHDEGAGCGAKAANPGCHRPQRAALVSALSPLSSRLLALSVIIGLIIIITPLPIPTGTDHSSRSPDSAGIHIHIGDRPRIATT